LLSNQANPHQKFQNALGQRGFFDQFTVTMNRQAQTVAIEDWRAFDDRFSIQYPT